MIHFKNKNIFLISGIIFSAAFLFFLFSVSSVSAAGCGKNQEEFSFSSFLNPVASLVEKVAKDFGYKVALAAPVSCSANACIATCDVGCSGSTPTVTISWSAAPAEFSFSYYILATGDWIYCASENQFCSFAGTRIVRYGANGQYVYGFYTNGVSCSNAVFGDPIPGVVKQCHIIDAYQISYPSTSYTVSSGLTNNTTYNWSVEAYNPSNQSSASMGFTNQPGGSFTTPNCTPPPVIYYNLDIIKSGLGSGVVTSNPAGIDCGASCNAAFSSGQSVTLNASASFGSTFAGWVSGSCSGTGSCTVVIDSPKTQQAMFSLVPPPPPPTASISADSTSIPYNAATIIRWSSSNASFCTVSPPGWTGTSGAQGTGNLTSSQTYTVNCSGPGGSASDSVTVNVSAPPPGNFSLSSGSVACNFVPLSWTSSSGADAYRILRGSPRVDISPYQPYTAQNFSDTGVSQNTSYAYQIEAYNSSGTNRSNTINVSTPYCPPTISLSASLSASPSSGSAPLQNVVLAADVSGTVAGTINYTFYCNRSDAGTNVTGGWAYKLDGTVNESYSAPAGVCDSIYSSVGAYTAKVVVERGSLSAEAREAVNVSGCVDASWNPNSNTVCVGQTFTQTSNCGNTRTETGTMNCPLPPSCSFSASPTAIIYPQSSTLSWNCQNTTICSINGQPTPTAVGSMPVQPSSTATYTLSCDNNISIPVTISVGFIPWIIEILPR